jgi:hypothetical protein
MAYWISISRSRAVRIGTVSRPYLNHRETNAMSTEMPEKKTAPLQENQSPKQGIGRSWGPLMREFVEGKKEVTRPGCQKKEKRGRKIYRHDETLGIVVSNSKAGGSDKQLTLTVRTVKSIT